MRSTDHNGATNAYAIYCYGAGETIQGNVVSNVIATYGYGVFANGCFTRQNTISNAAYGVHGGKYQDNLTLGCTTPLSSGTDAGGDNLGVVAPLLRSRRTNNIGLRRGARLLTGGSFSAAIAPADEQQREHIHSHQVDAKNGAGLPENSINMSAWL